jgi:hypothetical protein
MATYALVQRGKISAVAADGAGPKDFVLGTTVKAGSAFVQATVRDVRCREKVERGLEAFTTATTFPVTVNLTTAVDPLCSKVIVNHVEEQAAPNRGILVELINAGADLRFTSPALLAGETIDVAWQVIENKEPRGATVRILDTDTVRLEWDGTLVGTETIDAQFELYDIENLGDDIKEILFRQLRILGFHGENVVQDLIKYDDAGNPVTYRLRPFNSKVNADAATLEIPDGDPLQTGELTRVSVVQDFNIETNDRKSIIMTLTKGPAVNPDIN